MSYQNDDYGIDDAASYDDELDCQDQQKQKTDYDDSSSEDAKDDKKNVKYNVKDSKQQKQSDSEGEQFKQEEFQSADQSQQDLDLIDQIPQRRKQELQLYDSFGGQDQKPNTERISSPYISNYQKAMVIGKRAKQISKNSAIYVSVTEQELKQFNALDLAEMEFELNRIPMIIRRFLPDKSFEDWKLKELKRHPF